MDTSLFDAIDSQTSPDDRRSMLALQAAIASRLGTFSYLEIGSHLGGSIQPYLLDHRCVRIVSIDKRPSDQPDERGQRFAYPENSTARMLENLRRMSTDGVAKVITFDSDSAEIDSCRLPSRADVCFIDGEHTNAAAQSDFAFCESVLNELGVIYFHDSSIVFQAIDDIVTRLRTAGKAFFAYNLPQDIFVIDFSLDLHKDLRIQELLAQNHIGYLSALRSTAHYREFYNSWLATAVRTAYAVAPVRDAARAARELVERLLPGKLKG